MSGLSRKRRTRVYCVSHIAVALLTAAAVRPGTAAGQIQPNTGLKLVEVEPQTRADAVMITKITVGDRDVQCGLMISPRGVQPVAPFAAGDDWLQNMTVHIYNRTNKVIVFGQIVLGFPETGDGHVQSQRVYPVSFGRLPAMDAFSGRTGQPLTLDSQSKPISFAPDQTLVIRIADYIDRVRADVQNFMPLKMITKCAIHRGGFCFDDGMRWNDGGFAVPDPGRPGKFKHLDPNYFPGNRGRNWPPGYHQ